MAAISLRAHGYSKSAGRTEAPRAPARPSGPLWIRLPAMTAPEIVTIDCDYLHPRFAAAYLRVAGDEAAFVETNTAHAAPKLLAALADRGLRPDQVRWVIVTHVHLDHAGGAG